MRWKLMRAFFGAADMSQTILTETERLPDVGRH
ncbi:hypothetical protein MOMMJLID_CDS0022 [Arthrobacter phage 1191A]|nr:hypothetical protein MOMMJLID_CDS0022 [Arthrobacter phage 1191A]